MILAITFMILAITPEHTLPQELSTIPLLFEEGLDVLHVRKHGCTREDTKRYLESIPSAYRNRLVLHSYHDLAADFGIYRLHNNERARIARAESLECGEYVKLGARGEYVQQGDGLEHVALQNTWFNEIVRSTSTHNMDSFNRLESYWDYAFLSPLFPSLSKPGYGIANSVYTELPERSNKDVKLIGLGGVQPDNIEQAYAAGVDGVALLGALWQAANPLKIFTDCYKIIAKCH